MNLKKKIKTSGQIYFETHSPDISFASGTFAQTATQASEPIPEKVIQKKQGHARLIWSLSSASAVLATGIIVAIVVNTSTGGTAYAGIKALNAVVYPTGTSQNDFSVSSSYGNHVASFMSKTTKELYEDESQSFVYSPLSAYYALSLLLEGAKNNTYQQIADLLGVSDQESFRTDSQALYQNLYYDVTYSSWQGDKTAISKIANAVFLNESRANAIKKTYLDTLATQYYAEVFKTDFGSKSKDGIAEWLNDQTNDFLNVTPDDINVDPSTLLALYNTIYVKSNWLTGFNPNYNSQGPFRNTKTGLDSTVTYMTNNFYGTYVDVPDEYSLIVNGLYGGNKMVFVLPAEGVTPKTLLADDANMSAFLGYAYATPGNTHITFRLPKHSTFNKYELNGALIANGMTDAFSDLSDLTGIIDTGAYVSKVTQKVGIAFEEQGMEAAAYTEIGVSETATVPTDENKADFFLTKSFLYLLVSPDNVPLFVGVTNSI